MEVVTSVATDITKFFAKFIGRQICYVINYRNNIKSLKIQVQELTNRKASVQHSVTEARRRGDKIEAEVDEWLESVDGVTEDLNNFFEDEKDTAKKKCFMGFCPDLKTRHEISRKAKNEMMQAVIDLQKKMFENISYRPALQGIGTSSVKGYEAFGSRESILKEIMEALGDPNISTIGVSGMAGLGKTTLVNKVARKAKEENLVDEVVVATVSRNPNIKQLQGLLADVLGLKFDEETEGGRALRLCDRLKKEKRILIVLDDIWVKLDLEAVGIPCGTDHEGCKLLMTSRNKDVLSRDMDARKLLVLEALSDDEAWNLFEKMVGDVVKGMEFQPLAREIAKKCAGLPILLVTFARTLKHGNLDAWKDALNRVNKFDKEQMDEKMFSALQLSFNFLEGEEIKSLFLLCGQLVPHCISIMDLLKYAIGLNLFKRSNTIEEAKTRQQKLVNDLKASCLLLEGDDDGEVKMHDIVHNFAITIASTEHNVYSAFCDELKEWPARERFKHFTAISLLFCKIPDLPATLECPKLESFILYNQDSPLNIPDSFFMGMKELKVLDMSLMCLPTLPSSLQFLENLQTLCLDYCTLDDITILGQLKKLQVLSFKGSDIVRLPPEIMQLTCLRLLDLSNCPSLQVILPNILSCMTQLEDLYMQNSFLQWEGEGMNNRGKNANLAELKLLSNLVTLEIHVTNAAILPKDLFSEKLERFKILIGEGWDWSGNYETSRVLKLKLDTSSQLEKVNVLLKRTGDLYLDELKGIKSILYELDVQGFPQLKHLHVQNSSDIQYIVNSKGMGPCTCFPSLESLTLDNLNNLAKICHGQRTVKYFSNLRSLKVETCHRLKNLLPFSVAKGLAQLEEINITDCKIMEEIIVEESEDNVDENEVISLAQLRSLTLHHLPRLTSFCSKVKVPSTTKARSISKVLSLSQTKQKPLAAQIENGTLMPLLNRKVLFPNLKDLKLTSINIERIWHDQLVDLPSFFQNFTSLILDGCGNLKDLFSSDIVKSLVQLKHLEICDCKLMEEIIVMEGIEEEMMGELQFLKLSSLPKLKRFCASNLAVFPALKVLWIENCPELRTFISDPVLTTVVASSEVINSTLFDTKVAFPNLEELQILDMARLHMIWHNELNENSFCKLKKLKVQTAKELRNVFPSSTLSVMQSLESITIAGCGSLEEVFDIQVPLTLKETHTVVDTKLENLVFMDLLNLKHIWNKDVLEFFSFQNLRVMAAVRCPKLMSLFPASIARSLSQLEFLRIYSCGIEEIVAKDEGIGVIGFEFPQLTHLELWKLPELKRFYAGKHILEWPMLKFLRVYDCDAIEIFASECQNFQGACLGGQHESLHRQCLFSVEKVIPKLEEMPLNSNDTRVILNGKFSDDFYSKIKVLRLQCFNDNSAVFPFGLIQRFHNLKDLSVAKSCFDVIFSCEGFLSEENNRNNLPQIRSLGLFELPFLKYIWEQELQLEQVCKNLETLEISGCKTLYSLAPASASFQNLKTLEVEHCERLEYLVTSSIARSLVQLTKLVVIDCKMMTEIVANTRNTAEDEIVFGKLESLQLHCLSGLHSFCSANYTFKFPSLEEVILRQCPRMNVFSQGVLSTPKLQKVRLSKGKEKGYWEGNLNTTVEQMYREIVGFNGLTCLKLSDYPELKEIWHNQLPANFFIDLTSLVVDEFAFCSSAIPSNLLPFLNNLEELEVRNCNSVEEIFNTKIPNADERVGHLLKLKKVSLINLPRLKSTWHENPDRGLDLKKLQLLKIHNCSSLRSVLTPNMVLVLEQLLEIEVKCCPMVEEIITNFVADEATIDKIEFPQLNSVTLESLPKLTNLYSGSGTLVCPSLNKITIVDCPSIFTSKVLLQQEPCTTDDANIPRFPNMEKIRVEWNDAMEDIQHGRVKAEEFLYQLKILEVVHFPKECNVFPSCFFQKFSKLENLMLSDACFDEIVLNEKINSEETQAAVLPQLRELTLSKLPRLLHMSKEDSQPCPVLQKLETLEVSKCGRLRTFVSSSVSFQCLISLEVSECHGLENLITCSTARSLGQLTSLTVTESEMIEEIVAKEENDAGNEVTLGKLRCLELVSLRSLKSFHFGNCKFNMPSLEEVKVLNCPKMIAFSQGDVSTPKRGSLQLEGMAENEYWEGNLNTVIQKWFLEKTNPKQPTLDLEIAQMEENKMLAISKGLTYEDLSVPKSQDADQDLPSGFETAVEVTIEEDAFELSLTHPDAHETSDDKMDPTQDHSSTPVDPGIHLSTQAGKNLQQTPLDTDKYEPIQDQALFSSIQQSSSFPILHPAAVELAATSTSEQSTRTICRSTSPTLSDPVTEKSFRSPANFESLFATVEQLLNSSSASSSKSASNYDALTESHQSSGGKLESYGHLMALMKKILSKNLTEIARSTDGLLLLSTLKSLKNCPLLNSQQLDIVQFYIDNFDTLVTYYPFYEQQIDSFTTLKFSIEDDKSDIVEIRNRQEDLTSKSSLLTADKKASIKRLREIEEEENHIQEKMGVLFDQLVNKKEKIEASLNALPVAMSQQMNAKDKVGHANDYWTKISSLFA